MVEILLIHSTNQVIVRDGEVTFCHDIVATFTKDMNYS